MTAKTIPERFAEIAASSPQHTLFHFFREGWQMISYRQFAGQVLSVAGYLISIGLGKGDRVAIVAENRPEWALAYLSILTAGGVAVPIDPQLGPAELLNLLLDSETKILFHSRLTEETVTKVNEGLDVSGKTVIALGVDSLELICLSAQEEALRFPELTAEDIASIIYTSGTTGRPKGVVLTHHNFCSDADALMDAHIVDHDDNVLSVLPLYHTYAFMCTFLVPVFLGASITYPVSLKGPDLLAAIRDRGVSVLVGVPQLLGLLRNGIMKKISDLPGPLSYLLRKLHRISGGLREKYDINIGRIVFRSAHTALGRRFRFFASGGAKLDPLIMRDLEALGFTVLEGYGLTETSPVLTFNPASRRVPGSAGRPLPSVELRILGQSETGEGEITAKGPMVMKGYYKNPSETEAVFHEGWFKTGDIGRIDGDGYLFITGRSKEVIVLGSGKNIYPEDIERIYLLSPIIKEVCVLGIATEGATDALHAVIVPDFDYAKLAGITNIQETVKWEINGLSGRLPSSMRVTGFSISRDPLPRTPLGKLRRFMVKAVPASSAAARDNTAPEEEQASGDEIGRILSESLRQLSRTKGKIGPEDNLELDLGLDSLSKIELVVSLEKAFKIRLPEDFLADIYTVRELTEKVRRLSPAGLETDTAEKTGWKGILETGPSGEVRFADPGKFLMPVFLTHSLMKLLFKACFRVEARGVENVPSDRNFILAPNHTSYLDGFVLILSLPFSYFRNIYLLGLSDFFTGALRSWLAKISHIIPIDSSSYLNKALQTSAYILKNGHSLAVFPEGGRSFDGNLMEFKKGVGILAMETAVPVVPVYIRGTLEALPRTANWPRPRKITVTFGSPLSASDIDFSGKPDSSDVYQYFAEVLRERVLELRVQRQR